jgi:predicted ATP-grasp superfamily ATP-dependent carboligase
VTPDARARPAQRVPRILVTDCWTNKALSVVRSLGLAGVEVHALAHKRIGAALWSTFVARRIISPDPWTDVESYRAFLLRLLSAGGFDCVMPLDEPSIKALYSTREELTENDSRLILCLPPEEAFAKANDKWTTLCLAREVGVPIPESYLPSGEPDIADALRALHFPLVIKPRSGSGSRGLKVAESEQEFRKYYPEVRAMYGEPILQECIPRSGHGLGVGLLARNGEVLVSYSYKRLREFPVSGGPSTLRETTDDRLLKEYAARLMEVLNWTGVAMVEFKEDAGRGAPTLMEINPRFWGSLELAHVAGINFPDLLYRVFAGEDVKPVGYRVGVRCRWLIPGDVAHFLANPARFRLAPSFWRFFDEDTYYDEFKKYDVKGSVAAIICALLSIADRETWKVGVFRR